MPPPPRTTGTYQPPRAPRPTRDMRETHKSGPRMNRDIRVPEVRLVGEDGEMIGVVSIRDALQQAHEAGLDLVEISPQAVPPVCKILDYGKFKFEQDKKAAEAKKKQKIVELKEIKLRPGIGDHDYEIKMKQARKFLGEGDKVKFTLRFRGRELSRTDIGMIVLRRVRTELEGMVRVEFEPKFEGRQVTMIVAPLPNVAITAKTEEAAAKPEAPKAETIITKPLETPAE